MLLLFKVAYRLCAIHVDAAAQYVNAIVNAHVKRS